MTARQEEAAFLRGIVTLETENGPRLSVAVLAWGGGGGAIRKVAVLCSLYTQEMPTATRPSVLG